MQHEAQPEHSQQEPETSSSDSLEDLIERLNQAEARVRELEDELARVQADVENQRRRMAREMEQSRKYATRGLIEDLLPACDSLERGLAVDPGAAGSAEQQREGMALTLKLMLKALEKHGLSVIDPLGEPFNPEFHEAMAKQPAGEQPPGSVLVVLQKGYTLNERLVRPALVVVAAEN